MHSIGQFNQVQHAHADEFLGEETVKHAKKDNKSHQHSQSSHVQEEFLEYFNKHVIYDLKQQQVKHSIYGTVNIFQLKPHVQEQARLESGYPKWLPNKLAVAQLQLDQQQAIDIENLVKNNVLNLFYFNPQFVKIIATSRDNDVIKIFYEYQENSLENEIQERKAENRPFDENLVWKILYNLVKAQHQLSTQYPQQSVGKLTNDQLLYNNYKLQLVPHGLIPEIHNLYSPSEQHQIVYEIGLTLLKAGLLLTEAEFNPELIPQYLNDFGVRYNNSGDHYLYYILERLCLNSDHTLRTNFADLYNLLSSVESDIYFLRTHLLKAHLTGNFHVTYVAFSSYSGPQLSQQHHHHQHVSSGIQNLTQQIIRQSNQNIF